MVSRPGILAGRRAWREGGNGGRWLGVAHGRRCLNRALDRDVAVTVKMSPYHGAPRPVRVRAAPRTDRRSAVCTAHVRCNGGEARGVGKGEVSQARRRPGEGVWPRAARNLERRGVGRRAGAGAASRRRVRPVRFQFAEPQFEHDLRQKIE
jgi:hypothetical protein